MEILKILFGVMITVSVVLTLLYQKSNWILEGKYDRKLYAPKRFELSPSICPRWRLEDSPYFYTLKNLTVGPPKEKLTSLDHVTNATTSCVTVINRKTSYYMCDHIAVLIEARNLKNETKHYGGDYFRTKIYSTDPYSASGPDHFIDFQNGTYVALFTLRWSGEVKIHVSLVHPSEAVPILQRTTKDGKAGKLFTFFGIFQTKTAKQTFKEDVICSVAVMDVTPYCNVSANDTHGPWFCQRPKNSHLTCNDWAFHHMSTGKSSQKLYKSLSSTEKLIFKSSKKEVKTSEAPIQVLPGYVGPKAALPKCTSSYVPRTVATNGYFYQDKWQPLYCNITSFNSTNTQKCLQNKQVRLFGDSTARQMFMDLKGKLKWDCSENFFCRKGNASIRFTFHGLPIRDGHKIPVQNLTYVAREIEHMKGGNDVVIVLSIWAHFGQPEGSYYRERLLAVRGAVERLWQRSPGTRVIVRSANTRGHSIGGFILISSDWIALQGEQILRDVFSSDKRFDFLDVWDMSLVQKSRDDVHPLPSTLSQLMDNLLSLIC
ncbi:NXPE family member 3 [Holothuria leucospilota]|uniref:NXPE family member 3 n=1 Tax=Holothuria leucospilota TaxID=206669 RepID=A0A9Q1C947_HOLLE|nr:NXPE family member 3 [Holothuria leucospilota]